MKPLLSTRVCGYIDVKRVVAVEPLKHLICTKTWNRLDDGRGIVLFRACQNLRPQTPAENQNGSEGKGALALGSRF